MWRYTICTLPGRRYIKKLYHTNDKEKSNVLVFLIYIYIYIFLDNVCDC